MAWKVIVSSEDCPHRTNLSLSLNPIELKPEHRCRLTHNLCCEPCPAGMSQREFVSIEKWKPGG